MGQGCIAGLPGADVQPVPWAGFVSCWCKTATLAGWEPGSCELPGPRRLGFCRWVMFPLPPC